LERSDILRALQNLAPQDHTVLFYSDIAAKRSLIFPFLQDALAKQGMAVYATGHEPLDEVRAAMRLSGIDVDNREAERSLIIEDIRAFTTADGGLDDLKIDQALADYATHAGPIRIVADPTILVKQDMIDEVIRRERILRRRLELPLTVVCPYEDTVASAREGEFLIDMLRTHNYAIFPGIAMLLT